MSDNMPELRARLTPSPRHDRRRALAHDFKNLLTDLVMAVEAGDGRLAGFYAGELTRVYCEALAKDMAA